MKISCNVIKDLLPLYIEKLTSSDSNMLIEEHLKECENCRKKLEDLQSDTPKIRNDANELKHFKNSIKFHYIEIILMCVFIVTAIISTIWGVWGVSMDGSDVMAWCLIVLYGIFPFLSFVSSLILGMKRTNFKWFAPYIFFAIGSASGHAVINTPFELFEICFTLVPAFLGLITGLIIVKIKNRKK